ncbi:MULTISPECIES: hypothetical protein [Mycolicibacterium]|jgi:hypothetical protein|uniref:Uncharacterized protein n=2 Tax=Mycolicibacterium TaxID=1866885 RepID=A1T9H9_MYCVP|nr:MULTISPECIES: hypothetical protein [Mycolicibacterium]ABM13829.1 conserved hypothetical protein [Mycolicibacterium vanbaalenii PYR-1]MCV7126646.1 hypothetical protein [Mycolicibacterium vanbaalenii PYR-1]MDN4518831.1 hypothetical protein [Mycolicibacterium austroafricanum]MDW5609855.1 hypothetical protein [Mycolicibacterium sp. D5.8-2]PQP46161.1 hypothetical protein C6A88_18625 [Mycolicibacterium austroafricanum]
MTTPDPGQLGDAAEADVAEQLTPIDDVVDEDTWNDTQRVGEERDWQASEADLIEQSLAVPDDDAEFDR